MSSEPLLLKGLSHVVNKSAVKKGINIEEIEKSIAENAESSIDSTKIAEQALLEYGNKIGIDLGTIEDLYNTKDTSSTEKYPNRYGSNDRYSSKYSSNNSDNDNDQSEEEEDDAESTSSDHGYPSEYSNHISRNLENTTTRKEFPISVFSGSATELESRTAEEKTHMQIRNVMKKMGSESTSVFSVESERIEDMKATMLEEIDSLLISLEEEGEDITRLPKPSPSDPYEKIEAVHKILRLKVDRQRYCTFAEEFLLFGAHGLEELFNGENVWFGKYNPDLTGWHNQVQTKLRRMRHDTSQLVGKVMNEYNIGPLPRILLELVPGMFMYSKMRKQQSGSKKLTANSFNINDDLDALRKYE